MVGALVRGAARHGVVPRSSSVLLMSTKMSMNVLPLRLSTRPNATHTVDGVVFSTPVFSTSSSMSTTTTSTWSPTTIKSSSITASQRRVRVSLATSPSQTLQTSQTRCLQASACRRHAPADPPKHAATGASSSSSSSASSSPTSSLPRTESAATADDSRAATSADARRDNAPVADSTRRPQTRSYDTYDAVHAANGTMIAGTGAAAARTAFVLRPLLALLLAVLAALAWYCADALALLPSARLARNSVVAVEGPWHIHFYSYLPLNAISRLWGSLNAKQLPESIRPYVYRFYAWIFDCNLDEMSNPDLKSYKNLGEFFYRTLKPGVRPIDQTATLVSPADGKILHFGIIDADTRQVEQVKGMTYSLDALLGNKPIDVDEDNNQVNMSRSSSADTVIDIENEPNQQQPGEQQHHKKLHASDASFEAATLSNSEHLVHGQEFAEINSVKYSLVDFLGNRGHEVTNEFTQQEVRDGSGASVSSSNNSHKIPLGASDSGYDDHSGEREPLIASRNGSSSSSLSSQTTSVRTSSRSSSRSSIVDRNDKCDNETNQETNSRGVFSNAAGYLPRFVRNLFGSNEEKQLYFCVIYLAPGDYHHFHSPADWEIYRRRHFAGELFSVSPLMAGILKNLFVLNERVVLFGEWRHGFFSMIPVGATNVGSIKIDFDTELRTNSKRVLNRFKFTRMRTLLGRGGESESDSMESGDGSLTTSNGTTQSTTSDDRMAPVTQHVEPGSYVELAYKHVIKMSKGQEMGGFQLGSTVVLVFEAPKGFTFDVEAGQKVRVGERLGSIVR